MLPHPPARALFFHRKLSLLALAIFAMLLAASASFAQTCDTPPGGLVGWWQGEGNANDLANGDDGTLFGNTTYTAGVVGEAFLFDGSGCVILNNDTFLQLQDFTIEAWIQRGNLNPPGDELFFGFGHAGYGFGVSPNGALFLTRIDIDNTKSPFTITDSGFHHVAVTKTGTTVYFYLDGTPYAVPLYATTYSFGTGPAIGGRGDQPNGSGDFVGAIDELSIYNRALDPLEIRGIYNAGSAGKCTANIPAIATQPVSQTAPSGSFVTFSVVLNNFGPLSYQWFFGSNAISGANDSSFNLSNIIHASAGNYQVVVTNLNGSVTSSVAVLTVQNPPIIQGPPSSQSVYAGQSAVFSVFATGDAPLSYYWLFNGSNSVGQNDYSLIITNCQAVNSGSYSVLVSNIAGTMTSSPAMLTVFLPPAITNQPASQTNYTGGTAFFSVATLPGSGSPSYQWRFNGTNLPGATASALVLNNLQFNNAGNYSVNVSSPAGQILSSNALLTVLPAMCDPMPPGLMGWWQGENSSADVITGNIGTLVGDVTYVPGWVGTAFHFDGISSAVYVGSPTNYQLQDFTIDAWIKRDSATQTTLGENSDGAIFACGSGGYGLVISGSGEMYLTKIDYDNVTAASYVADTNWHHVAVTKSDTNVVFYLDGVAYPAPAYSTSYYFGSSAAVGARGDGYGSTFFGAIDEVDLFNRALSPAEIYSIYAATSLGKCPVPLIALSQATNESLTVGTNVTLTFDISGSGPLTCQWFQNGAAIAGATNATLLFSNLSYFQAGSYSVRIGNSLGTIMVSNLVVTVQPPPLLLNGSFETGDFTGWMTTNISLSLYPLEVYGEGFDPGFGFFFAQPTDGQSFAGGGFEGNGPGVTSLAQDIILPHGPALLTFDYRLAWDMLDYSGSTLPRTFAVTLQPCGGGTPFQTFTLVTAPPQTVDLDTGVLNGSLDLTPYSGRALRISFDANVPESFTGPGFFELDNVALSYSALPPLLISRAGNNLILTWPASTPNYTLQANNRLAASNGWTAVSANLIVYGATNSIATLPLPAQTTFYRLELP